MTRGCTRLRQKSRESVGCWIRSIHGNRLPVPILPRGPSANFATIWDPDGLPEAYPLDIGTTRDKEAILLFTRTQGPKGRLNKGQSVTCVHECQFSRSSVNQIRPRRAVLATRVETNRLRVRNSHDVRKVHQLPRSQANCSGEVHESARKPSYLCGQGYRKYFAKQRGRAHRDNATKPQGTCVIAAPYMKRSPPNYTKSTVNEMWRRDENSAQEKNPCLSWRDTP